MTVQDGNKGDGLEMQHILKFAARRNEPYVSAIIPLRVGEIDLEAESTIRTQGSVQCTRSMLLLACGKGRN